MRALLGPSGGSSGNMESRDTRVLVMKSGWLGSMAALGVSGGVGTHGSFSKPT